MAIYLSQTLQKEICDYYKSTHSSSATYRHFKIGAGTLYKILSYNNVTIYVKTLPTIFNKLVSSFGGHVLGKYKGTRVPVLVECKNGHVWNCYPTNVMHHNRWCKRCSNRKHKSEEIVRKIFEGLFNARFHTVHPSFLFNKKTGKPLELDGYNADLKVAFEYQGPQHYRNLNLKNPRSSDVSYIQKNDRIKCRLCKEQGIKLIKIRYFNPNNTNKQKLDHVIKRIKKQLGYIPNVTLSASKVFADYHTYDEIRLAEEDAGKQNLEFLGIKQGTKFCKQWINSATHYWYKCLSCRRIWKRLGQLTKKCGCPICNRLKSPSLFKKDLNLYGFVDAMIAVHELGIKNIREYYERYKEDPHLPSTLHRQYKEFWKGNRHFFGDCHG